MAKKKPKPVEAARQAALRGDVDVALPALVSCAEAGDDAAAASLAELLAFLGRWEEVIPNAARLIGNPFAVYAGNVFDDMVRLLGRAGHETGAWDRLEAVAANALRQVKARLQANDMNFAETKLRAERTRLGGILRRLAKYAAGRGAPPHELVRIFSTAPAFAPEEAAFRTALERNKGKPAARLLDLAIVFCVDTEAIRLYPAAADVTFEQAVYVAQALVRSGEPTRAWEVVWANVPNWAPIDAAQVAPVVLLTDELLRTITTPLRAETVVRTPRAHHA